jgi:DNA-binding XRE family transcriptional regulator
MPNIGTVLREEIARLSRKESRSQVDPIKKTTAQQRRDHSMLRRQVAHLEHQVALLSRKVLGAPSAGLPASTGKRVRFGAKGLRSQRSRLGLSAADFGKLLGVSAQSIYNWERELAHPRAEQLAKLVLLRAIGKREAGKRLDRLLGAQRSSPRKEDRPDRPGPA